MEIERPMAAINAAVVGMPRIGKKTSLSIAQPAAPMITQAPAPTSSTAAMPTEPK